VQEEEMVSGRMPVKTKYQSVLEEYGMIALGFLMEAQIW
jgi:hypothetical protein